MKSSYAEALKRVLAHEGGYTNDPKDPGGPTNYGITIADARMYWKSNATASDVRFMPIDVAKSIYKSKYWDRMDCDNLPAGVDYCVFDYGVNSGVNRAIRIWQEFKNKSAAATINDISDERLAFLKTAKNPKTGELLWPTYGRGWAKRVADVRNYSLVLANLLPPPPPDIPPVEPAEPNIWVSLFKAILSLFKKGN